MTYFEISGAFIGISAVMCHLSKKSLIKDRKTKQSNSSTTNLLLILSCIAAIVGFYYLYLGIYR